MKDKLIQLANDAYNTWYIEYYEYNNIKTCTVKGTIEEIVKQYKDIKLLRRANALYS